MGAFYRSGKSRGKHLSVSKDHRGRECEKNELVEFNQTKVLALNGCWQVPIAERPKNWQKYGLKEKE